MGIFYALIKPIQDIDCDGGYMNLYERSNCIATHTHTHTQMSGCKSDENRIRPIVYLTVWYPCQLPGFDIILELQRMSLYEETELNELFYNSLYL